MDGLYDRGDLAVSLLFSFLSTRIKGLRYRIRFQDRGREEEVVNMAPTPFRWIDLVPKRPVSDLPLFGEVNPSPLVRWSAQLVVQSGERGSLPVSID